VLRAITDDGSFRVITLRTTDTVRGAVSAQSVEGETARYFGDLLTSAVLFRETMAPTLRVQGIIKGAGGSGSLVADSHPSGRTRGLIQSRGGSRQLDFGSGAVLQLMRTLPSGRLHQGFVAVPESGGVARALMAYMQDSEQVLSMLAVSTIVSERDVVAAGGYMVQLLPEAARGPLMVMTERLKDFERIEQQLCDSSFSPSWLLDQLLDGMPFTRLEESALGFECWCDELRVVTALSSLPRSSIEELIRDGEVLEISCDYCGKEYRIAPARLHGLLERS
jgi:molecular chaperone Hsp33